MADIDLPPPSRSGFSSLPIELIRFVILYMDLSSIKSARLTCRLLCSLSTPYLILPKFYGFAHRPDFNRLLQLCRHPTFAPCIRSIELNLGEINEYHARHNTYFLQYTRDQETRVEAAEEAWLRYSSLKPLREEYTPWMCDPDILSEVFRSLPNLSALSISMATFPLPDEPELALLASIWKIPSTRLLRRELTKERFTIILFSLLRNIGDLKFRNLSHDFLPFEFFAQNKALFVSMAPIFHNLTDLHLVLDYTDMPSDLDTLQAFANIATCFKAATNLKNLDLCIQSKRKTDVTPLLEHLLPNSDGSKSTFTHLQRLHIEGGACKFAPLQKFLISLAPTLQVLEIGGEGRRFPNQLSNGGVHLLDGTFRKLFNDVEEAHGKSLTKFVVRGDLAELEAGGLWYVNREVGWHGVID
ncbi:5c0b10e4-8fd3-41fe-856f-66c9ae9eb7d6-CDS [Sclerotinia trifoliorum]|uniref:5c0b10e4-8fd3-41fe-856f-66c9ae9eb7d6-CDS n=1 Tax=Sclerotinia trifoliorum TaxID=28548 RepID=A0A8H2W4P2_9HELO|nr:5c0b10e4-8fd3-41fe-856f-66c9ae9eb7d6-CDS [Sclerotinia trifoliorum]